ncbi:MAG TPA: DinB family protein [Vicinamibacterales bacterium]|nr:DinB family protein [Vicinamibacterales bacterium]
MTYYGSERLADGFRTVRKNTITIAEEIPAEKYAFKATPEVMSVGEMLAHLAVSTPWHIDVHSRHVPLIDFAMFSARRVERMAEEAALAGAGKDAILAALRQQGDAFATFLEGLDEATLAETVRFPPPVKPEAKSRFEMLLGVKEHEMHHRGQLMLVQRLLGQVPHLTRVRQAQGQAQAAATK